MLTLLTALACGEPSPKPTPHTDPRTTSSTTPWTSTTSSSATEGACGDQTAYTSEVAGGLLVAVGGYQECLQPLSLADFCAGRSDWAAAFGGKCPSKEGLVAALESGVVDPIAGHDHGCAVQWSCGAGTTRIGLDPGYFDGGYQEAWFDADGAMIAYGDISGYWFDWCCDGTLVYRSWVGEPQSSAGCGELTTLECGGDDCYCSYYGTSGGSGGY